MTHQRFRLQPITNLTNVECITETPGFARAKYRRSAVPRKGLSYELAGHEWLLERFGYEYIPGPWFRYNTSDAPKRFNYVQPDGILVKVKEGTITIVEFKWAHNADAYYQLVDRYLPIVQKFFGKDIFTYQLLEICRWYDPAIVFPGASSLRKDILHIPDNEVGIHIWKPT